MRYRDKDGVRQRESTLTEDWDEAQKRLREHLQARDNNTLPALRRGQELTFGEWSDFYLENFSRPPFRAQKTHEVNQRALKHLRKMFESTKLAELTADDIEMYLRKRLKQRALVKTKAGFVEKQVLKATTVHQELRCAAADVERGRAQEVPICESMCRRRVSGASRWAVPAALRDVVGAAEDRVRGAGVPAQRHPHRHRNRIAHLQRADANEEGSARSGESDGVDSGLEDAQRSRRGSVDGHRGCCVHKAARDLRTGRLPFPER